MKTYIKLFLSLAAFGLLSCLSAATVHAAKLPPLEDDPLAYYYTEENTDRTQDTGSEAFASPESAISENIQRYDNPSVAFITDESLGISHDERFDGAKIRNGIDVSYYQGDIDWNAVKNSGVEFVFIRVGYRGLTTGSLNDDPKFTTYIQGALAADLRVGVYFFSQAITPAEAVEEANLVLARIASYNLSLPVVIDYEYGGSGSRVSNTGLSKEAATSICAAFCDRVASAGYSPMIYANKSMLENGLDGAYLGQKYKIWLAQYADKATYANKYSFWQYTSSGYVNGISTRVDMDIWYDTSNMILVGSENAKKYVTQAFNAFLDRNPDAPGLTSYVQALTQGELTASRLITSIYYSAEYQNKNISDAEFIRQAYKGMLGREAGDAEVEFMSAYLNNGMSRRFILSIISGSDEFSNFCSSLGMEKGHIPVTENRDLSYAYTSYVMRCYQQLFGRNADVSGLNTWTGSILNGGGGVSVISSLINSQEFRNKNYSNEEYVERIYQAMLGRSADPSGKATWVNLLEQGVSHLHIVSGFCGSDEFRALCQRYNMATGSITLTESRDQNSSVTGFVSRCYKNGLQRTPDVVGLNNWCFQILSGICSPENVAYGFVFSPEASSKFPSNDAFVEMLYRLCLDRGSDPIGKQNWTALLNSGVSRYSVFTGFTRSDEFRGIVSRYGL